MHLISGLRRGRSVLYPTRSGVLHKHSTIIMETSSMEIKDQIRVCGPDYNNCLVNLANSILKKYGAETTANRGCILCCRIDPRNQVFHFPDHILNPLPVRINDDITGARRKMQPEEIRFTRIPAFVVALFQRFL